MTQKRTLLKYGILSLALAAPLSACAFDSLTVIGDSLSDTGNNGRWTWDSGQNKFYDEQLAELYGLALSLPAMAVLIMPPAARRRPRN